jgi:hypothetical protein
MRSTVKPRIVGLPWVLRVKASCWPSEGSAQSEVRIISARYLEPELQNRLTRLATAKGIDFSTLVNVMLRKDVELIEMAK